MSQAMNRYAALLRVPGVVPLLAAGVLARLPLGMYGLAILLTVQRSAGSLAVAGLVTGAAAAANAAGGPLQARWIDRWGRTRPLLLCGAVNLIGFTALLAGAAAGAGTGLLAAAAALAGATVPAVAATQRAIWRRVLPSDLVGTAMAVDSMQLDAYLIVGPLLVGVLSWVSPLLALGCAMVSIAAGTLWFAGLPAVRQPPERPAGSASATARTPVPGERSDRRTGGPIRWLAALMGGGGPAAHVLGPLAVAGVRTVLTTVALTGVGIGAMRVGLAGFAGGSGDTGAVTWLLTAFGVGSLLGGLWAGSRTWRSSVDQRYLGLLCLFCGGLLLLVTGVSLPLMLVLSTVAGLALTPVTVCEFLLLAEAAPDDARTEAFAWGTTATFAGAAVGTALAGMAVEGVNWRVTVLAAACCPLLAAAVLAARRDTVRAAARPARPVA